MPAKKYITWAAMAFVAFYVITQPDGAAQSVENAATGISSAADSLATFVNSLA
ncbi:MULTISPECIES: hypothetical protein [Actinomadura]|uniref:Uncharacterized protein n=1 Tax=Actinomadura citrea TaxID=46158 RepID=A0A7Y9KBP8_9ACTN|nr:hypothetical protein [Actinomadura citrea]NYE09759.1 hypothetical protein [Actinomadura citrea]GGT63180.1 hypothetical protein GCM10010177_20320 [Actinomadura citrea]